MRIKYTFLFIAFLVVSLAHAQQKKSKNKYHTFLGVDVDYSSRKTYGLHVNGTYKGFSAEKAGVLPGDSLISINGEVVHNFEELVSTLDKHKPGEQVELTVIRNEKTQKIKATLSEYPDFLKYNSNGEPEFGDKGKMAYLGVQVSPVWDIYGGRITDMMDYSPAHEAGLIEGDIILRVDQNEFATQEELKYILSKYAAGDTPHLEILRNSKKMVLPVTLGEIKYEAKTKEKTKT